jgi:TrmH family RNA methyltransferase
MPLILRASNRHVKAVRALLRRTARQETGLYLVTGLHIVLEAIQGHADIEQLVIAPDLMKSPASLEVVEAQMRAGLPCLQVSAEVFQGFAGKDGFQGIAAVVRQRWEPLPDLGGGGALCWVALETVSYPGNLGTIMRTGDAVGAAGIILLGQTTDPYDPLAVRASAGAVFTQRLVRTTFEGFATWTQRQRALVVGTSPGAPVGYRAITYRPPIVLLMGSERFGLSREQQALCDVMVKIPMVGRGDSLNLGVATSILLYQIFEQHGAGAPGKGGDT